MSGLRHKPDRSKTGPEAINYLKRASGRQQYSLTRKRFPHKRGESRPCLERAYHEKGKAVHLIRKETRKRIAHNGKIADDGSSGLLEELGCSRVPYPGVTGRTQPKPYDVFLLYRHCARAVEWAGFVTPYFYTVGSNPTSGSKDCL